MRNIRVAAVIEYPPQRAQSALETYLEARQTPGGDVRVSLRLDLERFGGSIAHDVLMHVGRKSIDDAGRALYPISWTPVPAGAYPDFDGTLRVFPADDARYSTLELRGAYEAPLGAVGAAFDAVVGKHVAEATLHAFAGELALRVSPEHSSASRH